MNERIHGAIINWAREVTDMLCISNELSLENKQRVVGAFMAIPAPYKNKKIGTKVVLKKDAI